MGPTLVVFDMDGTLIDSQAAIIAAMRRGFAAAGLAPPEDARTLSVVGLSLSRAIAELAPRASAAARAALEEGYRQGYAELRAETGGEAASPLYPGARAALDRLARAPETLMGVATGKARRGLDHALAAHDLGGYFRTLQTADLHPSKPHPAMLAAAMRETGAARGIMVGDTEFDVAMAKNAGLAAVGVAWGYHPADRLVAAGADTVIEHFDALDAALRDLGGRA